MRKFFLVTLLLMILVLSLSGCTAEANKLDPTKTYWRINEKDLTTDTYTVPKLAYGDDGEIMKVGDAVNTLWKDYVSDVIDNFFDIPFEVIPKGTVFLEATDNGKFYIPDTEAFHNLTNGIMPEEIRLWCVFIDKDDNVRCIEQTLALGKGGREITRGQPDLRLHLFVVVNLKSEYTFSLFSRSVSFELRPFKHEGNW